MAIAFDIAWAHLRHRSRQSLVSVIGVAVGVGFFVAASSLLRGSELDFLARMVDAFPHVTVTDERIDPPTQPAVALYDGAVALHGLQPRDDVRGIRNYRRVLAEIERIDEVVTAPSLAGQAILRYGARDRGAALTGIVPARERQVRGIEEDLIGGALGDLDTTEAGIIVGHLLASRLGVEVGDLVAVIPSSGMIRLMKVVALLRTGVTSADETAAYVSLTDAQVLLDRPYAANRIGVRIAEPAAAEAVARQIEQRTGLRAESWQEANADVLSLLTVRNVIFYTIVGAILVVASFGIFNVVSTVVLEKSRDIAILKSMGFPETDIRRIFVLEGLTVGAVGTLVGWSLGWTLLAALGSIELQLGSMIQTERLPLDDSPIHYAVSGVFAVASATLAAWLPARKAARLHPVDILRGAA